MIGPIDWKEIRHALKNGAASLQSNGSQYWLVVPIDPDCARQIIALPNLIVDDRNRPAVRQAYRWRVHSPSQRILTGSAQ
jgi:hypothetical protein